MKDDIEFNIRFLSLIETNPCIYAHTSEEYSNRNLQELTWNKLAKELNESVCDCKERWKNLRGAFTRHLKYSNAASGSAAKKKKPYYLAEYMNFVLPFTKSRLIKSSIAIAPSSATVVNDSIDLEHGETESNRNYLDESTDDIYFEDVQSEESSVSSPTDRASSSCDTSKSHVIFKSVPVKSTVQEHCAAPKKPRMSSNKSSISLADVNKSAMEYFESKKALVRNTEINDEKFEDHDTLFLLSIQPYMKKMSDSQKIRFKIAILSSAGNILEEHIKNPSVGSMTNNEGAVVELKNNQTSSLDSIPTLERSLVELQNNDQNATPYGPMANKESTLIEIQNLPEITNLGNLRKYLRFNQGSLT